MKRILLSFLVIGILLLSACAAPTEAPPTPPAAEQRTQEIEDGWIRIAIKDVGSIDYPPDFLELQSGAYKEGTEQFHTILRMENSDFTLQQVGLNELKPSAFEEYRRVIFMTEYLNPGEEVLRANEKMSQEELAELENQLSVSLEIKEVNGMFPLVHTYTRQLGDNPVVLVENYMFQNYDKIHYLLFSCRVKDEEECRDIYDKILDSFRLQ